METRAGFSLGLILQHSPGNSLLSTLPSALCFMKCFALAGRNRNFSWLFWTLGIVPSATLRCRGKVLDLDSFFTLMWWSVFSLGPERAFFRFISLSLSPPSPSAFWYSSLWTIVILVSLNFQFYLNSEKLLDFAWIPPPSICYKLKTLPVVSRGNLWGLSNFASFFQWSLTCTPWCPILENTCYLYCTPFLSCFR